VQSANLWRRNVPTYSYACTACEHRFDTVQKFTDSSLTDCPECSGRLRKLFSAVGIVFKGSGFYRTDSRSGGHLHEGQSSSNGKSESGAHGKSESGGADGKSESGADKKSESHTNGKSTSDAKPSKSGSTDSKSRSTESKSRSGSASSTSSSTSATASAT
jgi:putative FmdB family regulatory protein